MAHTFSNGEKVETLEVHFKENRNSAIDCVSYAQLFPGRPQPHRTICN